MFLPSAECLEPLSHSAGNFLINENFLFFSILHRSIRDFKGGEFTCILALVSREQAEGESDAVSLLLQGGFNRVRDHLSVYLLLIRSD